MSGHGGASGTRGGASKACARLAAVAGLVVITLGLAPSGPAHAHGDARLVDDTMVLAPGESATFTSGLHYHRLVGRVDADGPVGVRLVDVASSRAAVARGPSSSIALNDLVRCCEGRTWAPHALVVENSGPGTVTVTARVALVHDDLAVMVDGAEPGTRSSVAIFAVAWAVLLSRLSGGTPRAASSGRAALVTLGGGGAALLLLAAYGGVRYGGLGAPGLLAALFDVPVLPVNPIVSRASLLLGVAIGSWYWASAHWVRRDGVMTSHRWVGGCLALAAVPVAAGGAVLAGYGRPAVPVTWAAAACLPLLVVMVRQRPRATTPVGSGAGPRFEAR
jgi:hypothetical protein